MGGYSAFINSLLASSFNNPLLASSEVLVSLSSQLNGISLSPNDISAIWFSSQDIREFLNIHDRDGITWFNQEAFEFLLDLTLGVLYINYQIESCQSTQSNQSLDLGIREIKKFMILSLKLSACNLDLFKVEISKYPGSY